MTVIYLPTNKRKHKKDAEIMGTEEAEPGEIEENSEDDEDVRTNETWRFAR